MKLGQNPVLRQFEFPAGRWFKLVSEQFPAAGNTQKFNY